MKKIISLILGAVMLLSLCGISFAKSVDVTDVIDSGWQATQVLDDETFFASFSQENDVIQITFELNRSNWGWENGSFVINNPGHWWQLEWDGGSGQKALSAETTDYKNYVLTIPFSTEIKDSNSNISTVGEAIKAGIADKATEGWGGQILMAYFYIDDNNSEADEMHVTDISIVCAHKSVELLDAVEPDCATGKAGRTEGYNVDVCPDCKQQFKKSEEIKAEHTPKNVEGVVEECEKDGVTAGVVCEVCEQVLEGCEKIPQVGKHEYDPETHLCTNVFSDKSTCGALDPEYCDHAEASIVDAKEADCTNKGYTGDEYCPTCKKTLEKGEEIPAKGHTEKVTPAVAATCDEDGSTEGKECTVCKEVLVKSEVVKAKGHSFGEYVETKKATVDAEGEKTATCSVCGAKDVKTIDKLPAPAKPGKDQLIKSQSPKGGEDITVFDGVDLSDPSIYVVITIETTEADKKDWGAGAIASKQEGWPAVYEIKGGETIGKRTEKLTGPELLAILKKTTRTEDQYGPAYSAGQVNFESGVVYNSWAEYAKLVKIEVYKKAAGTADAGAGTGDAMNIAIISFVAVLALAGVAFASKKRA